MKKAQITLFIILGIVILIAGALIFYYKTNISFEPDFVQPKFEPVRNYVQSCIDDITQDAVTTIGLNGGYLTFPENVERNPHSYLAIGPLGEFKNPYWWYEGVNAIPTEEFIIGQLESYISEQLKECTANFTAFEFNFIIEEDEIETFVELTDFNVDIKIKYPLTITDRVEGTKAKVSKYVRVVPVRLKKAYQLAKEVMEKENEDMFLEKKTIDLIALDPSIPYTNVEMTCKKKRWRILDLKDKLQRLVTINLPYIKVVGTSYKDTFVPTPEGGTKYSDSYYQHHYLWDVSDNVYEDMHVSFSYDNYPMRFNVRPNVGAYIESNSQKGAQMMSFFCLNIWHFTYDVVYPVRATIYDEETEGHDSYTFTYAFKVSVDHNQPVRENFATVTFEGRDRGDSEEYCREGDTLIDITTWDNITDDPISNANLTFTCGIYTCDLGSTDWINFGAAAGINQRMPYCVNGILKAEAGNYRDTQMFIQTGVEQSIELFMTPVKSFDDIEIVKHKYGGSVGQEESLEPGEEAFITVTQLNGTFSSYASYPTEGFPLELLAEEDYSYKLQVYLMNGEEITGGYEGEWNASWWDMEGADKLKIHVLQQYPVPTDENEQYLFLGGLESYSSGVPGPEFIIK